MTSIFSRAVAVALVAGMLAGCRETAPAVTARPAEPTTSRLARVEFTRLPSIEPSQVAMVVRVLGTGAEPAVASFTAAITYDATRLRYVGELDGGTGTVVANGAMPGVVRVAGFRDGGFTDGTLAMLVFEPRQPDPGTPVLAFTELHTVDGEDARAIAIAEPVGLRVDAR